MQETDRKTDNISLLKNFIHNWECEGWSFDMATHEKGEHPFDIFDITDDRSGALHTTAVKNTIVYVNETDGKDEIPSISSFHDPEGAVHYYLGKLHICRSANVALMTHNALTLLFSCRSHPKGHKEEDHGVLRIPANGDPVELKVRIDVLFPPDTLPEGYSFLEPILNSTGVLLAYLQD